MDNLLQVLTSPQAWLGALAIFAIRVVSISMDTLRFMLTMRGRSVIAWVLGFFETILFVIAMGAVLNNISNPLNVIAYAAGFATGNIIGMWLERKLAIGFTRMSIVSTQRGQAVSQALREANYGVTEIPGRGKDGVVTLIHLTVPRKDTSLAEKLVLETDPDAFITAEDVTPLRRGYWAGSRQRN
jgi:uncharacterized protein YebE (UPF0316 family)